MCNMPFFAERIDWGTSIRGAWWHPNNGTKFTLSTYALLDGEKCIENPTFTADEWTKFIEAVCDLARDK